MEKRIEFGGLLDIYGSLLTPRQRECMRLFYVEDLTAPEIAAETGVSRQAVHDALRSAENQLSLYESHIGAWRTRNRLEEARELLNGVEAARGKQSLDKARAILDQEVADIGV